MDEHRYLTTDHFAYGEPVESPQPSEREYPRERLQLVETVPTPFRPVPQVPRDEARLSAACRRKRGRRENLEPDQSPYAYWFDPAAARGDSLTRGRMSRRRPR